MKLSPFELMANSFANTAMVLCHHRPAAAQAALLGAVANISIHQLIHHLKPEVALDDALTEMRATFSELGTKLSDEIETIVRAARQAR